MKEIERVRDNERIWGRGRKRRVKEGANEEMGYKWKSNEWKKISWKNVRKRKKRESENEWESGNWLQKKDDERKEEIKEKVN